jgi:hypothetical protein
MIDRSALEDVACRLVEAMKAPSGVSLDHRLSYPTLPT